MGDTDISAKRTPVQPNPLFKKRDRGSLHLAISQSAQSSAPATSLLRFQQQIHDLNRKTTERASVFSIFYIKEQFPRPKPLGSDVWIVEQKLCHTIRINLFNLLSSGSIAPFQPLHFFPSSGFCFHPSRYRILSIHKRAQSRQHPDIIDQNECLLS